MDRVPGPACLSLKFSSANFSPLEGMSEDDVLAGAEGRMREMNAVVDRAVTASLVKLGVEMETQ